MSWQLEGVNLDGVEARKGPSGYVEPETGPYAVLIKSTEAYEKEGKTSVLFQCVIDEGEHKGSETRIYIGTDLSKVGNQRSWKTATASVGLQVNGTMNISASMFDGKRAFIYFKAKDPNDPTSQSDRQFITPEGYNSLKGTAAPQPASKSLNGNGAAAAPSVNVAPPPAGGRLRSLVKQ